MSQATPIKQDRIERHLARQRGAGVRTISTNFGFSFGIPFQPTTNAATSSTEPATKKRKLASGIEGEIGTRCKIEKRTRAKSTHCQDEPAGEKKARTRRRLDTNIEEEVSPPKLIAEENFTVINEAAKKKRGRPKKAPVVEVAKQESLQNDVHETSSRPRRRAAASAVARVTEGFIEEKAPIDKKRRDAEPLQERRRGRKPKPQAPQPSSSLALEPEAVPEEATQSLQQEPDVRSERPIPVARDPRARSAAAISQEDEGTRKAKKRSKRKRDVAVDGNEAASNDSNLDKKPKTGRRALQETSTNAIIGSMSPEKSEKAQLEKAPPEHHVESRESQHLSEKGGPKRPRKTAKQNRSSARLENGAESGRIPPEAAGRQEVSINDRETEARRLNSDQKAMPSAGAGTRRRPATQDKASLVRLPNNTNDAEDDPTRHQVSSVPSPAMKESRKMRLKNTRAVVKQDKINLQTRTRAARPMEETEKRESKDTTTTDEADELDWLLEQPKQARPSRQRTITRTRKPTHHSSKDADDVDLDDLLSNIAAFVPLSMRAAGGCGK
ncbi:unnamed protein product [Lecanosticta acicola]|uniref:Unnamed protein product n=1 Tax=Lecanosticta acicola TaxID=111012 RepID=A0AAI9EEP8_9PEZI|nr:unnamed protein product [Lecanosticta acicola]